MQFNIDDAAWEARYKQTYIEQVQPNTWFWNWFIVGLFGVWVLACTIPVAAYFARGHTGWSGPVAKHVAEMEGKEKKAQV
ncbi:hypothetical protein PG993_010965 [Apiospora rasikravindrae]|uniref:Uncharacterized protein n=1 Tax=Apiospora rasikravindrae TaxID=990691 RepID=A0ABR1SCW1_9PEZI